jgi:hypothetical protein
VTHLVIAIIALLAAGGGLVLTVRWTRQTKRLYEQAARDYQRAAAYSRQAAEIRAQHQPIKPKES